MRCLTAAAVLVTLALPAPAVAVVTPHAIAQKLRHDPLAVEPGAGLDETGRAAVRQRITTRAHGRIYIAVVTPGSVGRFGTVRDYANAIDRGLRRRGVLMVVAGSERQLVTSYEDFDLATDAVSGAIDATAGKPLVDELVASVDALAAADPGPASDLQETQQPPAVDIPENVVPNPGPLVQIDGDGIAKVLGLIALGIFGTLALIVAAVLVPRRVRAQRAARDRASFDLNAARAALAKLGEDVTALDLDSSLPSADTDGRNAYFAAVAKYEEAEQLLDTPTPSPDAVQRAGAALSAGRGYMDSARARLG